MGKERSEIMITQKQLKMLLHYDPKTGVFRWRVFRCGLAKKGDKAGNLDGTGYIIIGVKWKRYYAHRLAWLYMKGKWPRMLLDHKNQIRSDNRIFNLRESNYSQNMMNGGLAKNNTSGIRGMSWCSKMKKWKVTGRLNKKGIHLGYFSSKNKAKEAYRAFMKIQFGEFLPKEHNHVSNISRSQRRS